MGRFCYEGRPQTFPKKHQNHYVRVLEKDGGGVHVSELFAKTVKRPWVLLFWEPIVLIASIYMSILYGTLYMFLPALPVVYQEYRGWDAGIGSLPFLGLAVGMMFGLIYTIVDDKQRYQKLWYRGHARVSAAASDGGRHCASSGDIQLCLDKLP